MTDIDSQASIGLRADNGQLTARIPLRGQVPGAWLDCYQRLARAHRVPARAEGDTGRAWLVVSVPGSTSPEDVKETMDSARALIAAADEAAGVPLARNQAADSVRVSAPRSDGFLPWRWVSQSRCCCCCQLGSASARAGWCQRWKERSWHRHSSPTSAALGTSPRWSGCYRLPWCSCW